jgi:hypothetical protein
VDITADSIDLYLRERLQQRVRIKAYLGSKRSVKDVSGPYIENLAERGGIRTPGRSFGPYNGLAKRVIASGSLVSC